MNKTSKRFAVLATVATVVSTTASAFALTTSTADCDYTFNTNLKAGSRSADVMKLQKVLNADSATSIGNAGKETNFFGPATLAAVKKFQRANDITPVSGFVGALTRAELNQVCSGETTPTPTTPAPTDTGTNKPVDTNTNNNTNTPANNPISSVIVSGAARAKLADFTLTGNNNITAIQLKKIGISDNNVLTNVYLYEGNNRIADAVGVNNDGTITWNNLSVSVSGSKTISVYADVATGKSGQSVGVALTGIKKMGDTNWTAITGSQGPVLSIASVTLSTVTLKTPTNGNTELPAGTPNFTVWSAPVNVSTANGGTGVNFSGLTLKTIGSAPQNAFDNYRLFVNGVQQGQSSTLDNNSRVSFSFTPMLLKTGDHTVEVRADNKAGSGRTVQFTIESQGDALFSDTSYNSYVSLTKSGDANCSTYWTISCAQAPITTIKNGSLSLQSDPSFNVTRAIGGSSNVTIAKFIARAYGEDEKVYSITIKPTLSNGATNPVNNTSVGLKNVGVYLNGGQIGQLQDWNGVNDLTFNLGSQFVVTAGTIANLEIKADTLSYNTNLPYSSGTISANVSACNAYGNGSNGSNASGQTSSCIAPSVASLSIGSADGIFAVTGATSKNVSPNTNTQNIASFTFQAGQSEDITLNQINVTISGTADKNEIRQVTLMNGSTSLGTVYPNAGSGSLSFSTNGIVVKANSSLSLDLKADIGNIANGSTTIVSANASFRGNTSQTIGTNIASGMVTNTVALATFAAPLVSGATPLSQFLVGGNRKDVATFSLKTTTGQTTVQELYFLVNNASSSVSSLVIAGVSYPVVAGRVTATGLNIAVNTSAQDIVVQAETTCFGYTGNCNSNAITPNNFTVSLTGVKSAQSSVQMLGSSNGTALITGNIMYIVSSKPTVAVANTSNGVSAGKQKIAEVTVTADNAGSIYVKQLVFNTTISAPAGVTLTDAKLSDDNGNTSIAGFSPVTTVTSGTAYWFSNTNGYSIAAGQSKTFQLWATVAGAFGIAGNTSISTQLVNGSANHDSFRWLEGINGAAEQTGVAITGFPTGSYTLKN